MLESAKSQIPRRPGGITVLATTVAPAAFAPEPELA